MENIDRRMDAHILLGIREIVVDILVVSKLNDEDIRITLSKVIRQNGIEYDSIISPNQYLPKDYEVMVKLIEKKMLEKDIEIYIFRIRRALLAEEKSNKLTKGNILILIACALVVFSVFAYFIMKGLS